MKNPFSKENVIIYVIAILVVSAYVIYQNPEFLELKESDEISNEELLERSLDVTDRGLGLFNRILAIEGIWSTVIIGILIAVAIFLGLELRNKKEK